MNVVHARDVIAADRNSSDPYVTIFTPDQKEYHTSTISSTLNPIWKEKFSH